MTDLGQFLVVTSAITGRRILINKMAVIKIDEPPPSQPGFVATNIHFDPDMAVAAAESFDDIIEAFTQEENDELI